MTSPADSPLDTLARLTAPQGRLKARGRAYTGLVKAGRWILPGLALVLVALVIMRLQDNPLQQQLTQLPADERTTPGTIELEGASYEGTDEENRPYRLTAERALRADAAQDVVELEKPTARLQMDEASGIELSADQGSFDNEAGQLRLNGNVTLRDDSGHAILMPDVDVDLKGRSAETPNAVQGEGPQGAVTGSSLRIEEGGQKLFIGGPATLTLKAARQGQQGGDAMPQGAETTPQGGEAIPQGGGGGTPPVTGAPQDKRG